MNTKKCPDDCGFNWEQFHALLDVAMAHMIEETGMYPSKTSILELAQYSFDKKNIQEKK